MIEVETACIFLTFSFGSILPQSQVATTVPRSLTRNPGGHKVDLALGVSETHLDTTTTANSS